MDITIVIISYNSFDLVRNYVQNLSKKILKSDFDNMYDAISYEREIILNNINDPFGEIDIFGDGNQVRTFLYVDECIKATVKIYRDSQYLFPINVGSEQTVTINELINIICSIENKELKRNYITGPTGVKARSSNNDLIKDVLFWSPDQDLTFGIEKTYLWIKNQIKLRDGIL